MRKVTGVIILLFIVNCKLKSQVSFTLSNNACSGNTKTISANTGTDTAISYTWSSTPQIPSFSNPNSPITSIYFPTSGTYTITLTVTLLIGLETYSSAITVNVSPTITVAQSSPTTCIISDNPPYSNPVMINVSGGQTYTWTPILPPSVTGEEWPTKVVRPTVSTCYTITGSVGTCTGSAVSCVTVLNCTGVYSNSLDNINFSCYPNPVKDKLTLKFEESKINKISISNCLGQTIFNFENINGTKIEINMLDFPNGLYFLHAKSKTFKIIKE